MKNVFLLLALAGTLVFTTSCKKSSDDPSPAVQYTIAYLVQTTGAIIDTIAYKDANGVIQYLIKTDSLNLNVTQMSNNCHAYLYVSGSLPSVNSSYNISLTVTDPQSQIIHIKEDQTDGPLSHFTWHDRYDQTSN